MNINNYDNSVEIDNNKLLVDDNNTICHEISSSDDEMRELENRLEVLLHKISRSTIEVNNIVTTIDCDEYNRTLLENKYTSNIPIRELEEIENKINYTANITLGVSVGITALLTGGCILLKKYFF